MAKKTKPTVAVPVILLFTVLLLAASATGCISVMGVRAAADSPSATGAAPQTPEPSASPSTKPTATPPAPFKAEETNSPAVSQWKARYQPVLDQYREFTTLLNKTNGESDFSKWDWVVSDMMYSTREFGYAFRDMDSNGIPELFLLTSDGSIWGMYTYADGSPKRLGVFWARNVCDLDQSDVIYTDWSNGADDWGQDACKMSKNGRKLELIERVGEESTDENGKQLDEPRYYKCVGSEKNKKIISEAEADTELSKFPENNDHSGLEFLPLS